MVTRLWSQLMYLKTKFIICPKWAHAPQSTHSHQNSQWKSKICLVCSHWEQQIFNDTSVQLKFQGPEGMLRFKYRDSYAYLSSPKTNCGPTNRCLCFNLSYKVIWQVVNTFWVKALFYIDHVVDFLFSHLEISRGNMVLLFYCSVFVLFLFFWIHYFNSLSTRLRDMWLFKISSGKYRKVNAKAPKTISQNTNRRDTAQFLLWGHSYTNTKSHKISTKEKKYSPILLMNVDAKILKKIFANE